MAGSIGRNVHQNVVRPNRLLSRVGQGIGPARLQGSHVYNSPILLRFLVALPSVEARGRWRERGRVPRGGRGNRLESQPG